MKDYKQSLDDEISDLALEAILHFASLNITDLQKQIMLQYIKAAVRQAKTLGMAVAHEQLTEALTKGIEK